MPKNKRVWNGKTQYKSQFRWTDVNGKVHKSNTSWCNSKLEADKEAERLKAGKSTKVDISKGSKKMLVVFDEFQESIQERVDNEDLKNKSSDISLLQRIKAMKTKGYIPDEIMKVAIKDLNTAHFRKWLETLNRAKMSGETLRTYKSVIQKFNKYLANNGYYTNYNTDIEVAIAIGRVEIKPRKQGSRKDRRIPTVADIEWIRRYYDDDLGKFRNFYYYTFFYFEFYTGLRVSESIALKWKDVDLSPEGRVIYVRNAINGKEKRSTALKRTEIENYSTKNETSERGVVIFDMIYQLLKDYKYRYRVHYKITEKEQEDCFVFPALRNPNNYASHNHLLEELKKACEGAGIEPLDNGMMRHGCATFLVAPPPDGLGYSPEQVYSQLGHCDSTMLNTIYAALEKAQMTRKNRVVFNRIYHPEEDAKEQEHIKELEDIFYRIQGNNKTAEEVGKLMRFMQEIERVNESNNKVYYYNSGDERFIKMMNFEEKYPDIKFEKKDWKIKNIKYRKLI